MEKNNYKGQLQESYVTVEVVWIESSMTMLTEAFSRRSEVIDMALPELLRRCSRCTSSLLLVLRDGDTPKPLGPGW